MVDRLRNKLELTAYAQDTNMEVFCDNIRKQIFYFLT